IRRILLKSRLLRLSGGKIEIAPVGGRQRGRGSYLPIFAQLPAANELVSAWHHFLQQTFERGGSVMPKHGDLPIAMGREPIELNDTAFADKGFMAVPRIVAAFERQ